MKPKKDQEFGGYLIKISRIVSLITFAVILLLGLVILLLVSPNSVKLPEFAQNKSTDTKGDVIATTTSDAPKDDMWQAPNLDALPATPEGDQIRYGRELVAHTAQYLGPEGSVLHISNGMNCQNCHLDAGTKPFGNNYSLVASTYPKMRARSGTKEGVEKRVNDCFERSLNGEPLKHDSKEMQAMVAYIKWVGKDVKKDEEVKGSGLIDIELLDRAANPELGKAIYAQKCQVCHGEDGEGQKVADSKEYLYPPLWGKNSYNNGAGLYRVSNFAKYVKANMPLGATYDRPQLTDEESWDLAAYVNSLPRPVKPKGKTQDWPDISKKPMDHPFGPYADSFSEERHKYGPYQEILAAKKK
jgi:thiosulfate dehydrogenase